MRAEPLARGPEGGWEESPARVLAIWLGRETEVGPGCGSNRVGREGICLSSSSFPNSKFDRFSEPQFLQTRAGSLSKPQFPQLGDGSTSGP